jgi:hypothetical protein
MTEVARDTNGEMVTSEQLWDYIYEEVVNNESLYDVERFTRLAEDGIVTPQVDDDGAGKHVKLYVTEHLNETDATWMQATCQRALHQAMQDYTTLIDVFVY